MKKSLVLAMALAMGVTASAYAANPFSDVPAGHWAYDSISKLAAAGVINGYDGTHFGGDKLMTRYEMAQIVAKAMAKGANVDRLASEFADELDSLGVRVAKLEKKSDNVKITGQARYSYYDTTFKNDKTGDETKDNAQKLRSRLWFTGAVNDNWNFVSMLENNRNFLNDNSVKQTDITTEAEEGTAFQRAYLQGRLGGTKVTAGRYAQFLADGNIWDTRQDGIKVEYGKTVRGSAYYGRPTNIAAGYDFDKTWGVAVTGDMGKLNLAAGYDKYTNSISSTYEDMGIWNLAAKYNFGNASLSAMYLKSNLDSSNQYNNDASTGGMVIGATYLGAEAAKVGSWGLFAKYYNQGAGTFLAHTMCGDPTGFQKAGEGFHGWMLGGNWTLAKNMVADVEYYDLKGRESDNTAKTIWSQLLVTF